VVQLHNTGIDATAADFVLFGGDFVGPGNFAGVLDNQAGTVRMAAGSPAGTLTITGGYSQGANGTLILRVLPDSPNGLANSDLVAVSDVVSFAGVIEVDSTAMPPVSEMWRLVTYRSLIGRATPVIHAPDGYENTLGQGGTITTFNQSK
jgi:hypothetical protein